MAEIQKRSLAWTFFTDLGSRRAKCNFCNKVLSYKGGGPYNLIRHTKLMHQIQFTPSKTTQRRILLVQPKDVKPAIDNNTPENIIKMPQTTSNLKSFGALVPKKREMQTTPLLNKPIPEKAYNFNKYLVKLITKQFLDLSTIESKEFKQLINQLNPSYQIPDQSTIFYELFNDYNNITKYRIKDSLLQASFVSLSIDSWSSSAANENYLSLTAHFVDENNELKAFMLDCKQYAANQNLNAVLRNICVEWGIQEKIVAVTTNGTNTDIKAAIRSNNWEHITCLAHTINNSVQTAILELEDTEIKVRKFIELYQSNPSATEKIPKPKSRKNMPPPFKHREDIVIHWTSTFEMFEKILSIKSIISTISLDFLGVDILTEEDFEIISRTVELLSFFKDFTEEISSENKLTISEVILILHGLMRRCEKMLNHPIPSPVRNVSEDLLFELRQNYEAAENNNILAESTLLDPRFKKYGFSNDTAFEIAYSNLKDSISLAKVEDENEILVPFKPKRARNIWEDFDERVNDVVKSADPLGGDVIEIDEYLAEALLPRTKCPFKWWSDKKDYYPRSYEIFKMRMCIAATSVPSQRVFSQSGRNLTERRNMLSGESVPQTVLLNFNM